MKGKLEKWICNMGKWLAQRDGHKSLNFNHIDCSSIAWVAPATRKGCRMLIKEHMGNMPFGASSWSLNHNSTMIPLVEDLKKCWEQQRINTIDTQERKIPHLNPNMWCVSKSDKPNDSNNLKCWVYIIDWLIFNSRLNLPTRPNSKWFSSYI